MSIKVFYKTSGDDLTVVLKVRRHVTQPWQKPEPGIRETLSRELEKVSWNGELQKVGVSRFPHFLHWIIDDVIYPPRRVGNRLLTLGGREQYHLYRGTADKLPNIQSYCRDKGIEMQEGIEARIRDFHLNL